MKMHIPDMSCSHCSATISKAILAKDETAKVDFDMNRRMIEVETRNSSPEILLAIKDAGYSASLV